MGSNEISYLWVYGNEAVELTLAFKRSKVTIPSTASLNKVTVSKNKVPAYTD